MGGVGFPLAWKTYGSQVESSKTGLQSRRKATSHREDSRKCLCLQSGDYSHNLINTENQSGTFSLNNLPLPRTGPCLEIIAPVYWVPVSARRLLTAFRIVYKDRLHSETPLLILYTGRNPGLEGPCDLFNTHTAGQRDLEFELRTESGLFDTTLQETALRYPWQSQPERLSFLSREHTFQEPLMAHRVPNETTALGKRSWANIQCGQVVYPSLLFIRDCISFCPAR